MNYLFYLKWPLVILLSGYLIQITGSLMRVMHWKYGDNIIMTGSFIMILSVVALIVKLVILKKTTR